MRVRPSHAPRRPAHASPVGGGAQLALRQAARHAGVSTAVDCAADDAALLARALQRSARRASDAELASLGEPRSDEGEGDGAGAGVGAGAPASEYAEEASDEELCATCIVCQHLCYFSAVRCASCAVGRRTICLAHSHDALCACAPYLKFVELRHSDAELERMRADLAQLVGGAGAAAGALGPALGAGGGRQRRAA